MYLSEAGRGNRSSRSNPFQYHRPNAYTDGLNLSLFPRTTATWNELTIELPLRKQLMGLSPKYNDLGLGRDMAWYACPWELLVNSFN